MAGKLEVTMIIEEDQMFGSGIQHIFPSHEPHESSIGCACEPMLILHKVADVETIQMIKVYWHRWKRERAKEGVDNGIRRSAVSN